MSLDKESYLIGRQNASGADGVVLESITVYDNGVYKPSAGKAYNNVRVSVDKGIIPSGTKKVSENGLYPTEGFAEFEVDVKGGGDPYEMLKAFLDGTIQYAKLDVRAAQVSSAERQNGWKNAVFVSLKNEVPSQFTSNEFRSCGNLKYVRIDRFVQNNGIVANAFASDFALKSLVLNSRSYFTIQANAFTPSGISGATGYIYVPDTAEDGTNMPTYYKSATNWSAYATQIRGYSEAPLYNADTEYSIGDVCRFNGKFYGYCKSDLTSSVGNAPSGTNQDNEYWEYAADIEVNS